MKGCGVDMRVHTVVQVGHPFRDGDPCLARGDGQAHAADIASRGGIRQVVVEDIIDFLIIGRCAGAFGQFRLLHRQLHRGDQCGQGRIGGLHLVAPLFLFGDGVIQIFRSIHRRGCFIRSGDGFVQRGFQLGVVRVGLPRRAGNGPLAHGAKN